MNQVTLKSNGILEMQGKAVTSRALQLLGCQIVLEPKCTLRSYFYMIDSYPDFAQLSDFFKILCQQYANCPPQGCLWPDYTCLEFAKTVEMIGYPGQPRLEIYNCLRGVKDTQTEQVRSLALDFLMDMPLRLGQLKHIIFGDSVDTFSYDTIYTLFEFIDGIAWELSFHGAPPECQLRR
ncbi:MAG: hypothetical protein GY874_23325 [Desulfobacteraceae bacterium]|nr:hypothetical protein [Desulfobacteraceae bacterium]